MPETGQIMEALVKLASLGTSGICIFAIFWSGWLIARPGDEITSQRQRLLRDFMVFCVVTLLLSVGGALWSDARQVAALQKQIEESRQLQEQYRERERSYAVKGVVRKEDGSDPGDILIYTSYPPESTDGNGVIIGLHVRRQADGSFPWLGITCAGFDDTAVDLNDESSAQLTGNTIQLAPIELKLNKPTF